MYPWYRKTFYKEECKFKEKKQNYINMHVDINFVYNNPSETYHGVGPW